MQARSDEVIIFIPFSHSENNMELYNAAVQWQENAVKAGKKLPTIIIYRGAGETRKEYGTAVCDTFSNDTVPPGATVFMLAHGTGDPRWVANIQNPHGDCHKLPIELIAERAKTMGLTPKLSCVIKSFRLYTCEEAKDSNKSLAIHFAKALGPEYADLILSYYSAKVYTPCEFTFDKRIKKRAVIANNFNAILSAEKQLLSAEKQHQNPLVLAIMKESLEMMMKSSLVAAGKYKHSFFVHKVLDETSLPLDEPTQICMKTNKAFSLIATASMILTLCALILQTSSKKPNNDDDNNNASGKRMV